LDEVSAATKSAEKSRTGARESVVAAVRALETALQDRLDGGNLRGLKNLGHNRDPLYAARIRGKPDGRVRWPDSPNAANRTLVLTPKGKLQVAVCRTDVAGDMFDIELFDAVDEDIDVEDLENLLKTLIDIIPRTVAYADKARERYAGLRELSLNAMRLLTGEKV
jgi:hypothetical protein